MESLDCRLGTTAFGSVCGAGVPTCTRTTATAATVTGTVECMTMQRGQ